MHLTTFEGPMANSHLVVQPHDTATLLGYMTQPGDMHDLTQATADIKSSHGAFLRSWQPSITVFRRTLSEASVSGALFRNTYFMERKNSVTGLQNGRGYVSITEIV